MSDPDQKVGCDDKTKGNSPEFLRGNDIKERNPAVYIGGTYVIAVYGPPDCNCIADVTLPTKSKIEGEVPADNTTIGQKVTMQVDLSQTSDPKSLDEWKAWLSDKTNYKIRIRLWRSDQTDKMEGLSNTGDPPIWSTTSSLVPDTTGTTWNSLTKDQLIKYLGGGAASQVLYYDDLTKYPIPEGGKVSFRYNASVYISAVDKSGATVVKQCSTPQDSPDITWFRPMKDKPDVGNFYSIPKYFSEIKQGSPKLSGTSSDEDFDAMSGTPTTRSLYFASGGSEFIVDVQVEYVPKVTQKRTYKSEFNAVVNGWAMSPITGSTGHDSVPAQPAARTKTDDSGASYTESVTLHSAKHVTKAEVPCSGNPCTGGSPEESHTDYWWVQEGYDSHIVGGYVDTWEQTVTFDYMKINKAAVWKIERSKVNGMATLVGTNEVTATITQGDPNVFYNIAKTNTSADGRLRYSLETDQHDAVYWNEGNSDNALSNSKSGKVNEQEKFDKRREMTTNVIAISDFLILQTSQGDQSVMYFEKSSNTAKVTEQLEVPTTDFDTMWTNNPLSASKWDQKNTIRVGSYNGNYGSPTTKYSGGSQGLVPTVFDLKPAGLNRPARPAPYLRLMKTDLDVPDTLRNGEYVTGSSSVFYKLMFEPYNPNNLPLTYNTGVDSVYGEKGQNFASTYSPLHQKVNDVVIHDPVSVENAMIVSLPNSLDQRTPASKAIGGNKQEGVAEYERILDPNYRQNIIPNPDAEYANLDGAVAGWNTWVSSGDAKKITFTSRANDATWTIGGTRSFEVYSEAGSGTTGGYWKDVPIKPNTMYTFEGDIGCHRCTGYFALDTYTSDMVYTGQTVGNADKVSSTSSMAPVHKSVTFTTPSDAGYVRIHLIKGPTASTSYLYDYLFADNLSLKNRSLQEFVAIEPVSVTEEVPNPDYVPPKTNPSVSQTFNYKGSTETFTAPYDGIYTLEAWGAQGGDYSAGSITGGKGGYSKGEITLKAGDKLFVNVGQQGSVGGSSTFGGGGAAYDSSGTSGGGATDIRGGTSETELIKWDFSGGSMNGFNGGTIGISNPGSSLYGSAAYDGYFYSPTFATITGQSGDILEVSIKNNSSNTDGQVFYSYGGGMTEDRSGRFTMSANDSDYKVYRIDLNDTNGWGGGLTNMLRFDFANGNNSGSFEVKDIKLLRQEAGSNKIIVAGGGGGTSHSSSAQGGAGGGETGATGEYEGGSPIPYGGTQTSGYALGVGEPARSHGGGGGGGYWGGKSGASYESSSNHAGGGGGSGYIGGVTKGSMQSGVRSGHGLAVITAPDTISPAVGQPTKIITTLVGGSDKSPPSEAYILEPVTSNPGSTAGGYTPGNFVLLDHEFRLYFPNTGDFYGNGQWGWSQTTDTRGKGFIGAAPTGNGDEMDTTEWTKAKYVKFDFNVIYDGTLYKANDWISLDVPQTSFDFYVPLANREKISALVEWKSIAINAPSEDNETPTNKVRYENLAAKHSTLKRYQIDVVGRIGNMAIEDTGDFRFSNLFKQPLVPTQWLINNVVKKVNPNVQNRIVGDTTDIRGEAVTAGTSYLNTWGMLSHLQQSPISFPLSSDKNNIAALRKQPMRLGYEVLTDIQTMGNYYSNLQITPYYYHLNLQTGEISPVDIYMKVNGEYRLINKFGAVTPGWDPSVVYSNSVKLNWDSQSGRRNVTEEESELTSRIAALFSLSGGDSATGKAAEPYGTYQYGTSQFMQLTGRNRTYIGQDETYGDDKNPGNQLSMLEYAMQAQRWHYSFMLPSSAVAVKQGLPITQANIKELRNNTGVIILAADILAVGDTYALEYKGSGNGTLNLAGTSWPLTEIPYPVVGVYSAHKSSADDLEISGTH